MVGAATKKIVKRWGPSSSKAFDNLSRGLMERGFVGPLTWKHETSIPFLIDTCDNIRVMLSFATCGGVSDASFFDSFVVVMSKTILENTLYTDPWSLGVAGNDPWHDGYFPCFVASLAHIKWAQQPGTKNPAWLMTLEETPWPNVTNWFEDFDSLQLPFIRSLRSNSALDNEMLKAIHYKRPDWVKSDPPGSRNIHALLTVLRRGQAAQSEIPARAVGKK